MSYTAALPAIGYMPMPADFKYKSVFLHGKPRHDADDPFRIRHPVMPCSRRAKLFSPFDALRGFDAAIWSKEVLYEDRKQLGTTELEILNRKLEHLQKLTYNSRMARKNRPVVTVTYFSPCTDVNSFAYGSQGQYVSVMGIVRKVDPVISRTITLDEQVIEFSDISDISGSLFPDTDEFL